MTKDEEIKSLLKFMREKQKEHQQDPEKARKWLIRLGILDRSGKRLSRRYGG